jgi:hypothetical protein
MFTIKRVLLSKLRCDIALSTRVGFRNASSRPSSRPRAPEQKASKTYSQQSLERLQGAKSALGGAGAHESLENNTKFNSSVNKELNDLRKEFIKRSAGDEAIQSRRKAVGSAAPKKDEQ